MTLLTFTCEIEHRFAIVTTDEDEDYTVSCPLCNGPVNLVTDDPRVDPRELGGAVAGPGGPHDFGGVVLDLSHAILVDVQDIAKVDPEKGARGQNEAFLMLFEGRVNQSLDRARVALLGSLDFFAAAITEMHGVATRAGMGGKLIQMCQQRWGEMPK